MRAFSDDLRQRVLHAVLDEHLKQADVADRFSVSLSFVEKLLRQWRRSGTLQPRPHGGGRTRSIPAQSEPVLLALLDEDNDATDAEIAGRLAQATGLVVSARTVNRTWRRLGITRKKRRSGPPSGSART